MKRAHSEEGKPGQSRLPRDPSTGEEERTGIPRSSSCFSLPCVHRIRSVYVHTIPYSCGKNTPGSSGTAVPSAPRRRSSFGCSCLLLTHPPPEFLSCFQTLSPFNVPLILRHLHSIATNHRTSFFKSIRAFPLIHNGLFSLALIRLY